MGAIIAFGVRSMAIVEGRSMEPLFHTGDVVFLRSKTEDQIKVGDIVVYQMNGKYIIHRVVDIYKAGNITCYIVKGDNNPIPDPGNPSCPFINGLRGIPFSSVKGVVVTIEDTPIKIPYLGGVTLLLRG